MIIIDKNCDINDPNKPLALPVEEEEVEIILDDEGDNETEDGTLIIDDSEAEATNLIDEETIVTEQNSDE